MADYIYLPGDIASRLPEGFRITVRVAGGPRVSVEEARPGHKLSVEASRDRLVVESWLGDVYSLEGFLKAVDELAHLLVEGIYDIASWVETVDSLADAVYLDEYDPEELEAHRSFTEFRFRYRAGRK